MSDEGALFDVEPLRKIIDTTDETRKAKKIWKPKEGVRWERCRARRRVQCFTCVGKATLERSISAAAYVRVLTEIGHVTIKIWPDQTVREVPTYERTKQYLCERHAQDQLDADGKDRTRTEFEQGLRDFKPRR